jgi:Leucine-rich repeat (LRR) protein
LLALLSYVLVAPPIRAIKFKILRLPEYQLKFDDVANILYSMNELVELDVSSNNIEGVFDLGLLMMADNLQNFDVFKNRITMLKNSAQEDTHETIKSMDFSRNKLVHVDLDVFRTFKNLENVWLGDNLIKTLDGYSYLNTFYPKLRFIIISNNLWACKYLDDIVTNFNRSGVSTEALGYTISYENKSPDDLINTTVANIYCFDNETQLKEYEATLSHDYSVPKVNHNQWRFNRKCAEYDDLRFFQRLKLEELYLRSMNITGILDLARLVELEQLKTFYARNNRLTGLENSTKKKQSKMIKILLAYNELSYVDLNVFHNFENLQHLDLAENRITRIDGILTPNTILPKINTIIIVSNWWICIDLQYIITRLDYLAINWGRRLNIYGCPEGAHNYIEGACCFGSQESLTFNRLNSGIEHAEIRLRIKRELKEKLIKVIDEL